MGKRDDYKEANQYGKDLIFEQAMRERDNIIAFAKELLMEAGVPEKEALAQVFRAVHGKNGVGHMMKPPSPYKI